MKILLMFLFLLSCRAKTTLLFEKEGERIEEIKQQVLKQEEKIKELKGEVSVQCPLLLGKVDQLEKGEKGLLEKVERLRLNNLRLKNEYVKEVEKLRSYKKSYYVLVGVILVGVLLVFMLGVKRI